MGITRQQPGAAKAAAAAGTAIGAAAREKEDRARVEREQARANAEAMQRQARQDEMKFALQKRQVDWQRALDKERRQEDYKLAAEDRAVERGLAAADYTSQKALERIEFSKDLDHQYKTQERQRKVGEFDNQIKTLNEHADKGWVDRDFAWQDEMSQAKAGRDAALTDTPYREPPDSRAQELTENREARAADAAQRAASAEQRAQEGHELRAAGAPTEEEIQREQYETFLGDWAKSLSLPELKTEAQSEGFAPQQQIAAPSNIPYPTPNSQEAYDAIPSGSTYIDSAGNERTKS